MTYQGNYYLNRRNAVNRYSVFFSQETVGSLYIDILLDGGKAAFAEHTAGLEYILKSSDPSILGILGRAFSGYGQDFASLLDSLQGADVFNSYSTLVQSGPGQFWYA